jgi:hypothetical protein
LVDKTIKNVEESIRDESESVEKDLAEPSKGINQPAVHTRLQNYYNSWINPYIYTYKDSDILVLGGRPFAYDIFHKFPPIISVDNETLIGNTMIIYKEAKSSAGWKGPTRTARGCSALPQCLRMALTTARWIIQCWQTLARSKRHKKASKEQMNIIEKAWRLLRACGPMCRPTRRPTRPFRRRTP